MDWARAKSILIVAFLAVNIFLIYHLLSISEGSSVVVTRQKLEGVIEALQKNKVYVTADIDKKTRNIKPVSVSYKEFSQSELVNAFEEKSYVTALEEGKALQQGEAMVRLLDSRHLYYIDQAVEPVMNDDEESCIKIIEGFVKRMGLSKEKKYIKSQYSRDGYLTIIYGQKYKDYFVSGGYIKVTASSKGLREAELVWLDEIKPMKSADKILSPVFALTRTMRYLRTNPRAAQEYQLYNRLSMVMSNAKKSFGSATIREVTLGYFIQTEIDQSDEASISELNIALPVWKVDMGTEVLYINAYDEQIELIEDKYGRAK